MAKSTGLGNRLLVGGYDLSGDTGSIGRIGGGPTLLPSTGIDKSAMERLGGLLSGSCEFTGWFNDATDQAHDALSALPTADVGVIWASANTIGSSAAGFTAKQIDYGLERGDDGSLTTQVQAESNGVGVHFGNLLTAVVRDDGAIATNGASVDNAAASSDGLVAYLQVVAIASGSATITIESSSDDGAGDAFSSVVAFTAATTARTSQRVTASGSIERYLRVASSGTFTGLEFVVMAYRG